LMMPIDERRPLAWRLLSSPRASADQKRDGRELAAEPTQGAFD
jgi:hypothetical protein